MSNSDKKPITYEEFESRLNNILGDISSLEINTTGSFQTDETLGCPTVLNVCYEKHKAWLSLPHYVYDNLNSELVSQFEQCCAEWGIRECYTEEDFNNLLSSLGRDAENYLLEINEQDEDFSMTMQ